MKYGSSYLWNFQTKLRVKANLIRILINTKALGTNEHITVITRTFYFYFYFLSKVYIYGTEKIIFNELNIAQVIKVQESSSCQYLKPCGLCFLRKGTLLKIVAFLLCYQKYHNCEHLFHNMNF